MSPQPAPIKWSAHADNRAKLPVSADGQLPPRGLAGMERPGRAIDVLEVTMAAVDAYSCGTNVDGSVAFRLVVEVPGTERSVCLHVNMPSAGSCADLASVLLEGVTSLDRDQHGEVDGAAMLERCLGSYGYLADMA